MTLAVASVIEMDEVARSFRRRRGGLVRAVDGICMRVDAGEAVGYIGPNGAGKSTTIKMLTGVLVPTSGRIRVCGLDPVRQRRQLARQIGVVFGQRSQLWWDLPLRESFSLLAAIHRLSTVDFQARLDEYVDLLDMQSFLDTPVRQLSLGQRMRGEVTAALLHAPRLLVLDEPTIGLDLVSKERLRSALAALNASGRMTLVLTTHDLPDVERLCRRLIVVDHGRVLVDGPLEELRRRFSGTRELVVDLETPAEPLHGLPGVESVTVHAGGLRQHLTFATSHTTAAALIAAVVQLVAVRDLAVAEPAIEDVVRQLYAR
jgi:ABC-2 type transport system ATP-binding protein